MKRSLPVFQATIHLDKPTISEEQKQALAAQIRREINEAVTKEDVRFNTPETRMKIVDVTMDAVRRVPAPSLQARIQIDASDFGTDDDYVAGTTRDELEGEAVACSKKKPQVEKSTDTQGRIANADEDGGIELDEDGANVATKDIGANANLYATKDKPTLGNWGSDDDDDDDVVGRSSVGMEDEMDDDQSQVPEALRDND